MLMTRSRYIALGILLIFVFMALSVYFFYGRQTIYLYAWERPEDMSFLDSIDHKRMSVVYYAGDVVIDHGRANISPRRNSLFIPKNIKTIPLIRIDNFNDSSALQKNSGDIINFITRVCRDATSCQLDFDAKTSEYSAYIDIITAVRNNLPKVKITITALASWCGDNSWLNNLPIENAVPMLYRLGNDISVRRVLDDGRITSYTKCNRSVALSIDELDFEFKQYLNCRNIYLFNPESWTKESFTQLKNKLEI